MRASNVSTSSQHVSPKVGKIRNRIRAVCLTVIVVNFFLLLSPFFTRDHRFMGGDYMGGDFAAFYYAGDDLNHGTRLYQPRAFQEATAKGRPNEALPFLNTPFFGLLFQPLALLPYPAAYAVWMLVALTGYLLGFQLLWAVSRLPQDQKLDVLLLLLAFAPFQRYTLGAGQQAWFGFFWLALMVNLESRQKDFLAGLALSVCLYKPTLLLLILPALLLRGRFILLGGFAVGALGLALISISTVGTEGCMDYLNLMFSAVGDKTSRFPSFPLWKYVDIVSFFTLLLHKTWGILLSLVAWAAVLIRRPNINESIAWSLPVNLYTPMYDVTLGVIPALLMWRNTFRQKLIYAALFVLPWFSETVARKTGIQLMFVGLVAFALSSEDRPFDKSVAERRRLIRAVKEQEI